MKKLALVSLALVVILSACSSDPVASDAGPADASPSEASAPTEDAAPIPDASRPRDSGADVAYVEPTCALRNDSGGPGQYSDGCVRREWIAAYAGTYASAACELSVVAEGAVAATFTIKVVSGAKAGTYTIAWEGGAAGLGNDSYYRFTTDATFATTKTLNFNAGEKVGSGDERNASLRIEDLDKGVPVYRGRFAETVAGKTDETDCGTFTKR